MPDGEVYNAKGVVLINYALGCTSQAKPGLEDTPRRQFTSKTQNHGGMACVAGYRAACHDLQAKS